MDDGLGAGIGEGAVGRVVHVAAGVGDLDQRQGVDLVDVEFGVRRVALVELAEPVVLAFDDHAQRAPRALERFRPHVDHLAHVAAAVDGVVHHHQRAPAARILAAGDGDRVVQVEHAVGRHGRARTHRGDDDDRFFALDHQVQEVGGFLGRVGAVGDHDAVDVVLLEQRGDALAEGDQVVVAEALRSDLEDLVAAHVGDVGQLRQAGDQLVDGHFGGLIGSAVGGVRAGPGDRPAGGEDHHVGLALGEGAAAHQHGGHDGQSPFHESLFEHVSSFQGD